LSPMYETHHVSNIHCDEEVFLFYPPLSIWVLTCEELPRARWASLQSDSKAAVICPELVILTPQVLHG
jgi:hypothetical protein